MTKNEITLQYSSLRGVKSNTSYPFRKLVSGVDDLKEVAQFDHVGGMYADGENNRGKTVLGYRNKKTFLKSDCLILDCDNTVSDPLADDISPEEWVTPEDVHRAFPDVPFYAVFSRNHMKEKDGKAPRPKFHVYFIADEIRKEKEFAALKARVQKYFPAFDPEALDSARFLFGVENPQVEFYDGNTTINAFMVMKENSFGLPDSIPMGQCNSTLSQYAAKVLKKHGDGDTAYELFLSAADRCETPLDDTELNSIWTSAQSFFHKTIEASPNYVPAEEEESEIPPFVVFGRNGFTVSSPLLADYYLKRHTVIIVIDTGNPRLYEYEGGVYKYRSDLEVKAVLGDYIREYDRGKWQSSKVLEAYTAIVQTSALHMSQKDMNTYPDYVCLKNGLLNLKEWKLYPHDPKVYFTTQLDADFVEEFPDTPVYDKNLEDYCEGSSAKKQFLMQYEGAIFSNVPGYKFKRFLLTIGEKDSGKTVQKRLVETIIGKENFNNCDIADLEINRFAAASLHLKRLSGTNDLRGVKIPTVGKLLQLTGGDNMRVERKGEQDFSMLYEGFLWYAGNKRPIYGGTQNDALYLREILFELNHTIPQDKQDHHMLKKMLEERQGIILKCLYAARKAIYENGYRFDVPPECERSKEEHKQANNIVSQFIEECTLPLDLKGLSKAEATKHTAANVWKAFKHWRDDCCEYRGITRNDFESELSAACGVPLVSLKSMLRCNGNVGRYYPVMLNDEGTRRNEDIWIA